MSVCPANIQLHVSRRIPHSHALMSSAIPAKAGCGRARARAHAATVAENATANPSPERAFLTVPAMPAPYPATLNSPPS